jgi:oxalate decarboxylase/phosphoglucose isomerase-like protein (cupin superfamily)
MTRRVRPTIEVFPVTLDGRTVGHVRSDHAGERDEWEVHPDQDELLYLVSGATDVLLRDDPDDAAGERVIALTGGSACHVPRGAWHRQVVREPSLLFFLSPPSVHRPYVPADGWDG